ncbi:MAG: feruloyl-CoA synthase [Candidatus Eremiobacteraeota bacterium]|nr:feruloyl-CoA synthase [Candidatus Eremiobacteraeota bacterium]
MTGAPPPMRALRLGTPAVDVTTDGESTIVRNREPLGAYPEKLTARLEHWARNAAGRTFLAERVRGGDGWRSVTYGEALATVRAIAQALLDRKLSRERGVAILSENAIDHALLGLAAQIAGVPYAPVSPAYSLMSTDFEKLRYVMRALTPGLVYASDGTRYAAAIRAAVPGDTEVVVSAAPPGDRATTPFAALAETEVTPAVDAAHAAVGPDTIAKILFTSGSTGAPKGVINTQRMLCSNQQMLAQIFPFVRDEPPVLLDWLPWNHTFGGNHNFNMVLNNGGTLYVDGGKPTPAGIAETVRNLREIAPTAYFNVPKGFEMLLPFLRDEPALRARFFERLAMIFYSGAGLAPHVWDALQQLAVRETGYRILITTSLGSTETAPMALAAPWLADGPGYVGVPVPGVEVKLVPSGHKRELRLRGPNIMPGYWRDDERTRDAFDSDGFYRIGDALQFADENDPERGFVFDGRISEDFKLATGTWVSVGTLRLQIISHFAPFVIDAVVSGENRNEIAVLVFADVERCRALGDGVRAWFRERLVALARRSTGSATRVERLVFLDQPASLDAGEITDKGSLNQRAILARRTDAVQAAHAAEPPSEVIAIAPDHLTAR